MTRNAQYRTRAPKGVFRYSSHAEMDADRLRWTIDLMMEQRGLLKTKQGVSPKDQMDAAERRAALQRLRGS